MNFFGFSAESFESRALSAKLVKLIRQFVHKGELSLRPPVFDVVQRRGDQHRLPLQGDTGDGPVAGVGVTLQIMPHRRVSVSRHPRQQHQKGRGIVPIVGVEVIVEAVRTGVLVRNEETKTIEETEENDAAEGPTTQMVILLLV